MVKSQKRLDKIYIATIIILKDSKSFRHLFFANFPLSFIRRSVAIGCDYSFDKR